MKRAADLDAFRKNPRGAFLAGPTWLHGCVEDGFFMVSLWGRPSGDDIATLVRGLRVELEAHVPAHVSIVDARHLEGVDAAAFGELNAYVRAHLGPLSRAVTHLVLVRPGGLQGAVVAGFFQVLPSPYPVDVVDSLLAAMRVLGRDEVEAGHIHALVDDVRGADPFIGALQAVLRARMVDITLEEAARALSVSARTLQRRLGELGTSFQEQLQGVRLAESMRRMLDTDAPLTNIALDCGFASLQHFSSSFRKAHGASPSDWRKQHAR